MAIISHKLKTAFFVPQLPGIQRFKFFLHSLDNNHSQMRRPPRLRFIDRVQGYAAMPLGDALPLVPDGYKKVAVMMDPTDLLIMLHGATGTRQFKRSRTLAAVQAAGLNANPTLASFVRNVAAYKAVLPNIHDTLETQDSVVGRDLTIFDQILRIDQIEPVSEFFVDQIDAGLDPTVGVIAFTPPKLITKDAFDAAKQVTKSTYDAYGDDVEVTGSVFLQSYGKNPSAPPKLARGPAADGGLHVVCMLKETPEVAQRFVDYYQALGCESINLYFDDPEDPAASIVDGKDRVVVNRCGTEFWGGKRRKAVEGRQTDCYNHCYRKLSDRDGWLIVCDADEFVTGGEISLPALLQTVHDDQRIIRFRSAEAVWTTDAADFSAFSAKFVRMQVGPTVWAAISEKKSAEVRTGFRRGMLSHGSGKYAVRLGLEGAKPTIHQVHFADGYDAMRPAGATAAGLLVHFDAISYAHWQRKTENRLSGTSGFAALGQAREAQMNIYRAFNDEDRLSLFLEYYGIDSESFAALSSVGALYELDIFAGLPLVDTLQTAENRLST